MRDVEQAIIEASTQLAREHPQVSGTELRCRLHPYDHAQLVGALQSVATYTRTVGIGGTETTDLRMQSPIGTIQVETHGGYTKGVVSLMAPNVMDPMGIRPLSVNVKIYECCDLCTASEDDKELAQCVHHGTMVVTTHDHATATVCRVWLCEDCQDKHEAQQHTTIAEHRAKKTAERHERISKADAGALTDIDYAERMKRRRAFREGKAVMHIGDQTFISDGPMKAHTKEDTDA